MQIYGHWSTDHIGLHFERPRNYCGRPRLYFEPVKLLKFLNLMRIDPKLPKFMRIRIRATMPFTVSFVFLPYFLILQEERGLPR
jgi:hypothetical protein